MTNMLQVLIVIKEEFWIARIKIVNILSSHFIPNKSILLTEFSLVSGNSNNI